jgi:chromosome partitioning protein
MGQKCLLIDMDPQSNTTNGFGINKNNLEKNIYNVLINEIVLEDIVQGTVVDCLDIVPATTSLSGAEVDLVNMFNRKKTEICIRKIS